MLNNSFFAFACTAALMLLSYNAADRPQSAPTSADNAVPCEGVYLLTVPDNEYTLRPSLTLDSDENGEMTFTFSYDMLSSYLYYGKADISDGRLTAVTSDGKYTLVFDIVSENSLQFDKDDSSELFYTVGDISRIPDGALFAADFTESE